MKSCVAATIFIRSLTPVLAVTTLALALTSSIRAAEVTTTADSGPGSLRQIIAGAISGDTITFDPSLSGATITLTNGVLLVNNKNLTIDASALSNGIEIIGRGGSQIFELLDGNAVLNSLTITNGVGPSGGGILLNNGTLTLNQCTLSGNSGIGPGNGSGGGIFNSSGTLTLNECTLYGNSAGIGGGIYNGGIGTVTLNQCTLSGNSASGSGGGISNSGSTVTVNQCTLSGNSASSSGGGVYSPSSDSLAVSNSVVAGNTQLLGNDIYGTGVFTGVNLTNGTPLLAPLGNYGGPTLTMPPLPGSPAIDGCTNGTGFATDQRGYPRIVGTYADIGAVEGVYNPAGPGTLTGITKLGDGSVQFGFTNYSGMTYSVLASTNVAAPLNAWVNLGSAAEAPPGTFQFTDLQATNYPQRFYQVKGP